MLHLSMELDGEDKEAYNEELLDADAVHVYVDSFHDCFVGLARACDHAADDLDDEGAEIEENEDSCEEGGFEDPDLTFW